MSTRLAKIQITNPCSEDWNKMDIDSVGRICQSCMKSVVDFSGQTDEEITSYFTKHKNEQICGRFYKHQVDRIRIEIDKNVLFLEIPFWQKFLAVLLVCFGQDVFGYDFIFAQTENDTLPVITEQLDSLPVSNDSILAEKPAVRDTALVTEIQCKKEKQATISITVVDVIMISGSVTMEPEIPMTELPKITEAPFSVKNKLNNRDQAKDQRLPSEPKRKPIPESIALLPPTDDRRNKKKA